MREVLKFERERVPHLHGGGAQYTVAVLSIRWSHDSIDSRAALAHDRHAGQLIYNLHDQVLREERSPHNFKPLDVVRHERKL